MTDLEASTDTTCYWQLCTIKVPERFHQAGLMFCRDHALLTWSIVNEQLGMVQQEPDPEGFDVSYTAPSVLPRNPYRPFDTDWGTGPTQAEVVVAGVVYFIRTGQRIKIGYSTKLEQRLAQYPPDVEVLYLVKGDRERERYEHQRFGAYLADGREWFHDRAEVVELIEAMACVDGGWHLLIDDQWWRRRQNTAPALAVRRIGS